MPINPPRPHRLFALCCALITAGLLPAAQAAELGDASVKSYIGQPLAAEIELTALTDPAAQVLVRNASTDVYRGANIAINPALPSLTLTVQRRDGRQFVRASTSRAVDAAYLHLFLELVEGGKANIRPVTLWLAQDPSPPPAPVAAPVPAPVAAPVPAPAPASPRAASVITVPPAAPARPAAAREPEAETPPLRKPARVITLGSAPAAATEEKNRALTAQVAELEEKLRQLQAVVENKAAPAPAASDAAASAPADPAAAPIAASAPSPDAAAVANAASALAAPAVPPPPKKPAIPPPPKPSAKEEAPSGFPWLLVIGGVVGLALVGGGVFFFLKRRKAAPADGADSAEAAKPSLFSKLAARLRRNKPAEEEAPAPAG